jgi:hypothetical protein
LTDEAGHAYDSVLWRGESGLVTAQDCFVALLAVFVILGAAVLLVMLVLRHQIQRYDKFRNETAYVLTGLQEQLVDCNRRLADLGYPPGRVSPSRAPPWFANGQLPDGSPAPAHLRP